MDPSQTDVVLTYRNFEGHQGISHRGLSIAAANNAKVLLQSGINARVAPIQDLAQFKVFLANNSSATHVVISALWLATADVANLADQYPRVQFVVVSHSNVGFLQTDPKAVTMIRETIEVESLRWNVHIAGNSKPFCDWVIRGLGAPCTYLPNLYYLDATSAPVRPPWGARGGTLRLGCFGAARAQKNMITQVAAAQIVARQLKCNVEYMMNGGRNDGGEAPRLMAAIQNMVRGLYNFKLTIIPWAPWPNFREYVATRDVLSQNSYSESMNLVTCDGVAMGVPSAVSHAIDWTPTDWQVEVDDPDVLANKIMSLATDVTAAERGLRALQAHNAEGLDFWLMYILNNRFGTGGHMWPATGVPRNYVVGNQSLESPRLRWAS